MKKAIKRGLSMLFVVAFLVSAMSVPVSAAKKTSQSQQYKIFTYKRCNIATALDMNNLLDAYANGKDPGTDIGIWAVNWGEAQDFTLELSEDKDYAENGWYLIKNTASGLCVDLEYGSTEDGANVFLCDENGGANQFWQFIPTTFGYLIRNGVGTYLTAAPLQDGYFTNVYCSHYTGGVNQRWFVNPSNGTLTKSWIEFDVPAVNGKEALINFRYRVYDKYGPNIGIDARPFNSFTKSYWTWRVEKEDSAYAQYGRYGHGTLTVNGKKKGTPQFTLFAYNKDFQRQIVASKEIISFKVK